MTKCLLQDFRVDIRSCEHTYDPIRFINDVHPLLLRLTRFARQIVIEAFTHWECPERKGEMVGYRQERDAPMATVNI